MRLKVLDGKLVVEPDLLPMTACGAYQPGASLARPRNAFSHAAMALLWGGISRSGSRLTSDPIKRLLVLP